jgi:hypothetical protein
MMENEAPKNPGTQETVFVMYVKGFAPELMRGVAFRLDKHFRARDKKILKCPYCGGEFETVGCDVKVQLRGFKRGAVIDSHETIPCRICNGPVGIVHVA